MNFENNEQQLLTKSESKILLFFSNIKSIVNSFQSIIEELCLSETSQKTVQ